jgi:plasmid stabilization system protein ParE
MLVSFHELAERELNDGAQYYEVQQAGLGSAFIAEVRRCSDAICAYPDAGPIARGDVRRRLCQRFPYAVLYTTRPGAVRILAVMNLKRRPMYWVGRR